MELYKTVLKEAVAEQIIEKSKFITYVKPVETKEEADEFISQIKSKHKDATHNVPAMVIGEKSQIQWASDDGEPQGTSGAPMVQMMVKEGLTNLVVVVTRYFGGVKLGTGGLVRAYTSSAKLGIEAAQICSVREICEIKIKTDYSYLAKLQNMSYDRLVPELQGEDLQFVIGDIEYTDKIILRIFVLPEDEKNALNMVANLTSGTAEIVEKQTVLEKV